MLSISHLYCRGEGKDKGTSLSLERECHWSTGTSCCQSHVVVIGERVVDAAGECEKLLVGNRQAIWQVRTKKKCHMVVAMVRTNSHPNHA